MEIKNIIMVIVKKKKQVSFNEQQWNLVLYIDQKDSFNNEEFKICCQGRS